MDIKEVKKILESDYGYDNLQENINETAWFVDSIIKDTIEIVKLNYTHSCEKLKEKEAQSFDDWIDFNGYRTEYTNFIENGFSYDINKLYRKYTEAIK